MGGMGLFFYYDGGFGESPRIYFKGQVVQMGIAIILR